SLVPRHRIVLVVVNHQQRRLHSIRTEDRRVVEIAQRIIPKAAADARLRALILKLSWQTRAPTNATVSARHVCHESARSRRFEAIRLRDHVRDLITAPTVSLDADRVLIYVTFIDHGLDSRQ